MKKALIFIFISSMLLLSGCNNNKTYELTPVSENDFDSFASTFSNEGESDIDDGPTSIEGMYHIYTGYDSFGLPFETLKQYSCEITLLGKSQISCFYINKEAFDFIEKNPYSKMAEDNVLPEKGLISYVNYYYSEPVVKASSLMEITIDINTRSIPLTINEYHLLDVVRYYNEKAYPNVSFVDFVSYNIKGQRAYLKTNENPDAYTYRYFPDVAVSLEELLRRHKYWLIFSVQYESLLIEKEGSDEIVRGSYSYSEDFINSNPTYYDDLKKCIKRTYDYRISVNRDIFEAVFYYKKLMELFGLE